MEVLIRPFRPNDWDGLFLLDRACFVPPYRLEYPRLKALVQDPTVAVIVIEAREPPSAPEGAAPQPVETASGVPATSGDPKAGAPALQEDSRSAVVGGMFLKHDTEGARLVILSVMVEPGFRRVGLARRLVGWAERIATARRLTELLAPLEAENLDGAVFLAAMGFAREPGTLPFFSDPAGGNLWRKPLAIPQSAPGSADEAEATSGQASVSTAGETT